MNLALVSRLLYSLFKAEPKITNKVYCLLIVRINKFVDRINSCVDARICAPTLSSKTKMDENEENVDPMHDAVPNTNSCV